MRAASLNAGTSTAPVTNGLPCKTTGPFWVRKRLWPDGSDQMLRFTPALRSTSARYGNPFMRGRIASAVFIATVRLSMASLMELLLIRLEYRESGDAPQA